MMAIMMMAIMINGDDNDGDDGDGGDRGDRGDDQRPSQCSP